MLVFFVVMILIRVSSGQKGNSSQVDRGYRVLCKSESNRVIAGVCGGIAEYFGWSAAVVRLFFIFSGVGILSYIILAVVIPESNSRL